ncbi:hypothetical protein [Brevundimonas sp.]|uniref:hypothetical protein n=1 Tax=Brevundimonas sp. TaxID=1871086 RepID=UPI003A8F4617
MFLSFEIGIERKNSMQEFVPELLFPGGVQLIVIGVEPSPRRLDLVQHLGGPGQGQRRPGPPLDLGRRHVCRRAQQLPHPIGKIPRGHLPVSNPFFRHG